MTHACPTGLISILAVLIAGIDWHAPACTRPAYCNEDRLNLQSQSSEWEYVYRPVQSPCGIVGILRLEFVFMSKLCAPGMFNSFEPKLAYL